MLAWLRYLTKRAWERSKGEKTGELYVIEEFSKLLMEHVLLRDPAGRYSAKKVKDELRKIQGLLASHNKFETGPESKSFRKTLNKLSRMHLPYSKKGGKVLDEESPSSWRFEIQDSSSQRRLSPDGRYLCVASKEIIATRLVSVIRNEAGNVSMTLTPPESTRWDEFILGLRYLCATRSSESGYFKVLSLVTTTSGRFSLINNSVLTYL